MCSGVNAAFSHWCQPCKGGRRACRVKTALALRPPGSGALPAASVSLVSHSPGGHSCGSPTVPPGSGPAGTHGSHA